MTVTTMAGGSGHARRECRALLVVWRRELMHLSRDRARIAITLIQPLLFLLVLGAGFSSLAPASASSDYRTFLFPGVLVMAIQGPAVAAGASIVSDRQTGFLREMLVAPVGRGTLLLGKCLGGATMATYQGVLLLACAGFARVPYQVSLLTTLAVQLALTAVVMTTLGAVLAVLIRRPQTFQTVLSVLLAPILFLSGAFVPVHSLPAVLRWVAYANPVSYATDAVRRTVLARLDGPVPPQFRAGLSWGGWRPPTLVELALLAAFGGGLLLLGARWFNRTD